jgi:glycosyltransferase involved in cell wall biosynthesis
VDTELTSGRRIAIISHSFPPYGGGGITSLHANLYNALKSKGFRVRIFTFGDHGLRQSGEVDVIRHGSPKAIIRMLRILNRLYFRISERSTFAYQVLDILESALGSLLINRPLKAFAPDVVILPDHNAPGLFLRKKTKGVSWILVSHHNPKRFLNNPLIGVHSHKDAAVAVRLENRVLTKVDKVVCPSNYMRSVFSDTYDFSGPVSVVPNLIDTGLLLSVPEQDIRGKIGLSPDAPVVYVPSAGGKLKGSRFVFEIIRRLAGTTGGDVGFYLSGAVDEELRYECTYAPRNARIHMPGKVSYHDNMGLIRSCSFAISPTLIENLSMSLLEACFCGLPVVTFDVGGNSDIVRDGENGFLVPYLDVERFIERSGRLLLDTQERKRMGDNAIALMKTAFDPEKTIGQYLQLF